jgi:hypothetical protein
MSGIYDDRQELSRSVRIEDEDVQIIASRIKEQYDKTFKGVTPIQRCHAREKFAELVGKGIVQI